MGYRTGKDLDTWAKKAQLLDEGCWNCGVKREYRQTERQDVAIAVCPECFLMDEVPRPGFESFDYMEFYETAIECGLDLSKKGGSMHAIPFGPHAKRKETPESKQARILMPDFTKK